MFLLQAVYQLAQKIFQSCATDKAQGPVLWFREICSPKVVRIVAKKNYGTFLGNSPKSKCLRNIQRNSIKVYMKTSTISFFRLFFFFINFQQIKNFFLRQKIVEKKVVDQRNGMFSTHVTNERICSTKKYCRV